MTKDSIKVLEITIRKMNIKDGDYLFIEFPENSEKELYERAQETVRMLFPELRVIIHNIPLNFKIVHQESEEKEISK